MSEITFWNCTERSTLSFFFSLQEMSTPCWTLALKLLLSWTENPHLSFRGTDVSTFLRLFYDTFHRDRAVRQLLLTAFQYLRMRPAAGWDRVRLRSGPTLLHSCLVIGNESGMIVRAMSDEMIKFRIRLTEGYAKRQVAVCLLLHRSAGQMTCNVVFCTFLINWTHIIHHVTSLPHPQ